MKKHSRFYTDKQGRVRYIADKTKSSDDAIMTHAPERRKAGSFITTEGRVVFVGGPGAGGGSSGAGTNNIVMPEKLSGIELINMRLWQNENLNTGIVPVYLSDTTLPPVASDKVRIFHGTQLKHVESIAKNGLLPGNISGQGERLDTILGVQGKPSSFGTVNVVIDVPKDKFIQLGGTDMSWGGANQSFKPEEIVGFLIPRDFHNKV